MQQGETAIERFACEYTSHLPYHTNFYHTQHIPGHVVLMVGLDEENIYVHDNSKQGVQYIPLNDLQLAWANDYIGISKEVCKDFLDKF